MTLVGWRGARIFDGRRLFNDHALLTEGDRIAGIVPEGECPAGAVLREVDRGLLMPGFVDLQANGGGGVMFNDEPSVEGLRVIAAAHASTGTAALLPTLITDTPERTRLAIDAVARAVAEGIPGIAGLHLEGPHLSISRKGAHDAALIRPMADADEALLCEAAARLPALKVTVAPESVTPERIARLARAGVLVSLGHSDCSYEAAMAGFAAGARCVTHLFNAMSPLGHRAPGLVGAALDAGKVSAGIIADGIHVHPAALRAAAAVKRGPGRLFLVTDAMATLGSDVQEFVLNGRRVSRHAGRLTLEDGTLAGADLTMAEALRLLRAETDLPEARILAMATSVPAGLLPRAGGLGRLRKGDAARVIHLDQTGEPLPVTGLPGPL